MQFPPSLQYMALILALVTFLGSFRAEAAEGNYKDPNEIIRSLAPIEYLPEHSGEKAARTIDLNIRFELNSAKLQPEARRQLEALATALSSEKLKALRFRIAGHTDASGPAAYNMKLSKKRAAAVAAYLADEFKVDPSRFETEGYGEEKLKNPVAPTAAENRRVEVSLIQPPPNVEKPKAGKDKDGLEVGKDGEVKITW